MEWTRGWLLEPSWLKPAHNKLKGNQHAIAAVKDRRATLAGEIQQFKDAIAYRHEQLAHLDATIKLLDPNFPIDTIPPKRPRRVKLFAAGEWAGQSGTRCARQTTRHSVRRRSPRPSPRTTGADRPEYRALT